MFIPDDGGSTHLWNVGRQSFYTAVHPRRQFWRYFILLMFGIFREFMCVLLPYISDEVWRQNVMYHIIPTSKGDPLCPLGFHPQVRWPTRCKRCFRCVSAENRHLPHRCVDWLIDWLMPWLINCLWNSQLWYITTHCLEINCVLDVITVGLSPTCLKRSFMMF
jgi:hypothetical protein